MFIQQVVDKSPGKSGEPDKYVRALYTIVLALKEIKRYCTVSSTATSVYSIPNGYFELLLHHFRYVVLFLEDSANYFVTCESHRYIILKKTSLINFLVSRKI